MNKLTRADSVLRMVEGQHSPDLKLTEKPINLTMEKEEQEERRHRMRWQYVCTY